MLVIILSTREKEMYKNSKTRYF